MVMAMGGRDGDDITDVAATVLGASVAGSAANKVVEEKGLSALIGSTKVTAFTALSALAAGYSVIWGYIQTRKIIRNWLQRQ